jgi:TonB family protein
MGEQVPVPHLPAPGSIPPDASAKLRPPPGSPGDPETPKPGGEPEGGSSFEGREAARAGGASPDPGGPGPADAGGTVAGTPTGGLEVPRLGGGARPDGEGRGAGGRRGLDLSLPPGRGAFGDFSFEDKDYDWSDYWSQMYWAIWRAWMNRLYVGISSFDRWSVQRRTQTLKGTVLIRFVIERNGSVSVIEVLEPSVLGPLDDSAQAALKEAILPRLPDDFTKESEAVTGRFSMEIDSLHSWREELKYMKYRGVF